eukprot:366166-Chlamydomonas_euryale.AAC.14
MPVSKDLHACLKGMHQADGTARLKLYVVAWDATTAAATKRMALDPTLHCRPHAHKAGRNEQMPCLFGPVACALCQPPDARRHGMHAVHAAPTVPFEQELACGMTT